MGFYENKEHLQQIISIINGESKISLRIVDWFVTNYAKKNYTMYKLDNFLNGDIQELINKLISEDQAKKIAENMNNA